MLKRKKDGGFTLIELMIVIAVIGILAVVLAPKMSSVKESAKATGAIANAKSVEAFVIANIDQWKKNGTNATIQTAINDQFLTNTPPDLLENPFGTGAAIQVEVKSGDALTFAKGKVVVLVDMDGATKQIEIKAYGNTASNIVFTKVVSPN